MSVGHIATPSVRGWQPIAAIALAATFAIGMVSGLVVTRNLTHVADAGAAVAVAAVADTSAYGLFRQGERAGLGISSDAQANQLFRQGERGDLSVSAGAQADQLFRQGERADLGGPSAVQLNKLFRQGERNP